MHDIRHIARQPVAIILALSLLVLITLAVRSSSALQQTITLAPGDGVTVTCSTSLTGSVQGTQATLQCAAPAPTATPVPVAPTITELRGVQEGQTLSGKVNIEAVVGGQNVTQVVFTLAGATPAQHIETRAPWFFMSDTNGVPTGWDTTKHTNGAYTLTVTASNSAGQTATRKVNFTINNVAAPPAQPTAQPTTVPQQPTGSQFLQAQGRDLVWQGQRVLLKGVNFDNIPALGANIGSGRIEDIRYDERDYAELSRQGGNHVRLGLSFSWYQQDKARYFAAMDQHVAWARKHGIWLVFNQFTTPGNCYEGYSNRCGFWGSAAEQQQLLDFWVEMARRYKNEPSVAGYDLLNEPNPAACSQWLGIAGRMRDAIYAVAPNQLVFIETCADPANDLRSSSMPRGANIVYQVHDYSPLALTHDYSGNGVYPGYANSWFGRCYYNKSVFEGTPYPGNAPACATHANIRETYGLNWAQQQNVPIYIGEWGITARVRGYIQWVTDKAELYRDWGISHAYHTWKHQTIVTGGYYQSGIYGYDDVNGLRLDDVERLRAVQISWQGAVKPVFGSGTVPQPTAAPQPTTAPQGPTPVPQPLPAPWTARDIGAAPQAGGTSHANGSYTLRSSAGDIWGSADAFHFVAQPLNGDGTIVARVSSLTAGNAWAKAGLMIREGTAANARHTFLAMTPSNGLAFQQRTAAGSATQHVVGTGGNAPVWLRLTRAGSTISAASSTDGVNWTNVGQTSVAFPSSVVVGLALSSHDSGLAASATFDQVAVTAGGQPAQPTAAPTQAAPTAAPQAPTPTAAPTQAAPTAAPQLPTPTTAPTQVAAGSPTFYRAINVNGASATIGGNAWEGKGAPNFTINGTGMANQWLGFNPQPDAETTKMLQDWQQHWDFDVAMSAVPNGTYQVYIYAMQDWNDPNPAQNSIKLEGADVGSHRMGAAGTWSRLGPYTASVSDGTINLRVSGLFNIAGLEVWKVQ